MIDKTFYIFGEEENEVNISRPLWQTGLDVYVFTLRLKYNGRQYSIRGLEYLIIAAGGLLPEDLTHDDFFEMMNEDFTFSPEATERMEAAGVHIPVGIWPETFEKLLKNGSWDFQRVE